MIITRKEINDYCRACTTDESVANGFIYDIESAIIKPALGVALFNDVEQHPENFHDLLYGSEWEDKNGVKLFHDGLVRVEAYYAYSRIIRGSNVTATRYGAVQKNGDYSTPASESSFAAVSSQTKAQADMMFERVLAYCKHSGLIAENVKPSANRNYIHVYKIGE